MAAAPFNTSRRLCSDLMVILPFADAKAVKLYGQLEACVYDALKSV
jgi:hypothetical protein